MLNVAGQVRLQDSAWLAQLAKQASALASATRKLPLLEIGVAVAAPVKIRNNIVRNSDFISNLPTSTRKALAVTDRSCTPSAAAGVNFGLAYDELFDLVAGLERSG